MHYWGDEGVDWESITKAAHWISSQLRRWGRFTVHGKEKYGTCRLEYFSHAYDLHSLVHSGRLFVNWGKFMWWFNYKVFTPFCEKTGLFKLFWKYQDFIFNMVTLRAAKKWPHIKKEMFDELEYQEILYKWVKKKIGFIDHWRSC